MKKYLLIYLGMLLLLLNADLLNAKSNKSIPCKKSASTALMWIDATANIERFNNKDTIDFYLQKIKKLGFTDIVVDIRPISGYVLYDSEYAPKFTEFRGKPIVYTFDYLGYYIEEAHKIGLKVQASMNTFVAGNNFVDKGIIYEQGKSEWASIVYPPVVDGKFIPITQEKQKYSAMVNPVNEEFQKYILNIFAEVATKYPKLDGILLDRVRYDGFTADFSDLSRQKFEEYLGTKLDKFPDDIYVWKEDEQKNLYPQKGKYYLQWLEWRSTVIYDFMVKARKTVKAVNPDLSFGTYTGAWYPSYFEVGVNFASKNYDPSKEFDWATPTYKNTGYAELMDLFSVGNYYKNITKEQYIANNTAVKNETDMYAKKNIWYSVEGSCENLRTIMGKNKFLGGILVSDFYKNPKGLTESIEMNLKKSDGVMLFDVVHVIDKNMWKEVEEGMRAGGAIK
ncbi:MAG: alpha amylase family protein [Bacteroidales bacterium]|nr:alpha amylase family protein [Bacteroidales bacterium]MDD4711838.1 alpha amylase family protein [Bacteroidales bacterium]MEA4839596.1 alpha amylase family protein [Bacteroidales bacterium]